MLTLARCFRQLPISGVLAAALLLLHPLGYSQIREINPDRSDLDAAGNPDPANIQNPDPDGASGGRVTGLARAPGSSQIFYAASEWGGLFKTTDAGRNWTRLNGHLPVATWDVAVDPFNPQRVYATSFYDGRIASMAGIEVSSDAGATWARPGSATPPASFNCSANRRNEPSAFGIGIRPDAPRNVFVGTNCGVAISGDAGATWRFVDPTPVTAATDIWDVLVQAGGPAGQGIVDVCGDDGHFRSTDGGNTWVAGGAVPTGPGAPCSLAASPDESYVLFLIAADFNLYESDDGGATWNVSINPSPQGRTPFVVTNQRSNAGPVDRFDLWFGDVRLFRAGCTTPNPRAPGGAPRCPPPAAWAGPFTRTAGAHDDSGDLAFDPGVPVLPLVIPAVPLFSVRAPDVGGPPGPVACESSALLGPPGTGVGCTRPAPAPDRRLTAATLGLDLTGPFTDDLDAISLGGPPRPGTPPLQFSVDTASAGRPCGLDDVSSEASGGEAHGDIFAGLLPCSRRFRDEREQGLNAPGTPTDDLDALADAPLDNSCLNGAGCKVFSVTAGSSLVGMVDPLGNRISPADLLVAPGAPNCPPGGGPCVAVPATALGLDGSGPGSDDLDAVCWLDLNGNRIPDLPQTGAVPDRYFFSLAPGSAQMATFSAADVLTVGPSGPVVTLRAEALGLLATDNIDALECTLPPPVPVQRADACPVLFSSDGGVYYNTRSRTSSPDCHTPAWEQPDVTPHALWVFALDGAEQPGMEEEALHFGNQDNGTFSTLDAGAPAPAWSNKDCCDSFDTPADPNRVVYSICCYSVAPAIRLFRRNPGMVGGGPVNPPPGRLLGFRPLPSMDTFGEQRAVAVTTTGVFATTNVGATPIVWGPVGTNPPANACSVQVALTRGEPYVYVLAGLKAGGVRRGCDGGDLGTTGQLWRHQGIGPGGAWVRADAGLANVGVFAVDPLDHSRLYASDLPPAAPRMVFSNDAGATWIPDPDLDTLMTGGATFRYQTNLGPTDFRSFNGYAQPSLLAFNPEDPSCIVAGGRDSGVFSSNDGGKNWSAVTTVAPVVPRPWQAYFDNEVSQVFLGTQGRGVWRFPLSCPLDFGDADPDYPTRLTRNGARHASTRHEWLGKPLIEHDRSVSEEFNASDPADVDGVPNVPGGADGFDLDRFDDGVVFFPLTYAPGRRGKVQFNVCADAVGERYDPADPDKTLYLNAWIDWDTDQEWEEVNQEHIIDGLRLAPTSPGAWAPLGLRSATANVTQIGTAADGRCGLYEADFPVGSMGQQALWSRFRLDYGEDAGRNDPRPRFRSHPSLRDPNLGPGELQPPGQGLGYAQGEARYGEVEDYRIGADFGDAPDLEALYPTRKSSLGARHLDIYKEWLGRSKTRETNACSEAGPEEDQDGVFNLGGSCNASNLDRAEESTAVLDLTSRSLTVSFTARSTISLRGYDLMGLDADGDGRTDEDPASDGVNEDMDQDGMGQERDGEDGPDRIQVMSLDPADPRCGQRAFEVLSTPPWSGGKGRYFSTEVDDDRDGQLNEDPINGADDDNDGSTDEDPPGVRPLFANIFVDWNGDLDWDDAGEHVLQDALIAPETFGGNGNYTLGEPFVDANQNGAFDAGESFTDSAGVDQKSYGCRFEIPPGEDIPVSFWVRIRLGYTERNSQTLDELVQVGVAHSQEDTRQLRAEKGGALFGEVEDTPVRFLPYKFYLPPYIVPPDTIHYRIVLPASEKLTTQADGWIQDSLPEGVNFGGNLSCDQGDCRFDESSRTVRWEGTLAPGTSVTVEYDVTVPREYPPGIPTIVNRARVYDGVDTFTLTTETPVRRAPPRRTRLEFQTEWLWQDRRLEDPFPVRETAALGELGEEPITQLVTGFQEQARLELYLLKAFWSLSQRVEIHGRLGAGRLHTDLRDFQGLVMVGNRTVPSAPFPFLDSVEGTGEPGLAFGAGLDAELYRHPQRRVSLALRTSWTQLRSSEPWSITDRLTPSGSPITVEKSRSDWVNLALEARFGSGRFTPMVGLGTSWFRTEFEGMFSPSLPVLVDFQLQGPIEPQTFQFTTEPEHLPVWGTAGFRYRISDRLSMFVTGAGGSQGTFGFQGGVAIDF